jgi:hypothetical protein
MGHTTQDPTQELRNSPRFLAWRPVIPIPPEPEPDENGRYFEMACLMKERHYTPQELAEIWGVSVQTIRDVFRNEEGVLKLGSDGNRMRRGYKTLRIPESVAERVHQRLSA